jgi:hypothetical protein
MNPPERTIQNDVNWLAKNRASVIPDDNRANVKISDKNRPMCRLSRQTSGATGCNETDPQWEKGPAISDRAPFQRM